jgi:ATP-dependent RNA helicase DHX57
MAMLSELCQKQKWDKPEYTMRRRDDGFHSSVILKAVHPKTKEKVVLPPLELPQAERHLIAKPTAAEARHAAATYALYRVNSMKNIHMMLPPDYRDLWKGRYQELKQADQKAGNGWMYEADPFAAKEERDQAQAAIAKKRADVAKVRKEAESNAAPGSQGPNSKDKSLMRGWNHVPKVDMGKKMRQQVEDMIRQHSTWNPNGHQISPSHLMSIVQELSDLGFRKAHVEEAAEYCKDREEVLEWLLIHVPEDDLPQWSLPENYVAGISFATSNPQREAAIKRLSEGGYSTVMATKALDEHKTEDEAAEALQTLLVAESSDDPPLDGLTLESTPDAETWEEEMNTLEAIYDDRFTKTSQTTCKVQVEVDKTKMILTVRKSRNYPATPPIISLSGGLPSYIRLSIYRQALENAKTTMLGGPMIYNIMDWLEAEVPRIVQSPGRLKDVSGASTAAPVGVTVKQRNSKHKQHKVPIRWTQNDDRSRDLLQRWHNRQQTPAQQKMLSARQSLPAWKLKEIIVETVSSNQVTIISGETGSGKSTQSVQFILDDMIQQGYGSSANIVCTQPRRISALGLADRVSDERCGRVGEEIGFAIRGESKQQQGITKITFVTTGVLLRRLQTSGGSTTDVVNALADISHVVVDEVHERSLDTDFLLVLLRDVLRQRKDLKVILMSATLDAGVFEQYFRSASTVGKVNIEGRTFPVTDYYLDDILKLTNYNNANANMATAIQSVGMHINYDLIAATVLGIDSQLGSEDGGILIFLPGVAEINRMIDALRQMSNVHALPLHASLTPAEQKRVFPSAPKGKRKVIAATNVAETSITIEDIVAVIDTGKVKETSFDIQNNMVKLEEVWASRAACKQRRGRAGRVRAGECFKIFTRNAEVKMPERPEPEIKRVPLEQLCLSVRAMGIKDVSAFLASALSPPAVMAVEGALDLLARMGALDGEDLTALGRHLSMIPADLRLGKLMVYGALFGCLEASVTMAAILTVRSPFLSPQEKRAESKAIRSGFAQNQGDLIADLHAYEQWSEMRRSNNTRAVRMWCDENFLNNQTLFDISSNRTQYFSSLRDAGFLPYSYDPNSTASQASNANNSNSALLRAVVAGAFNPQIARIAFPDKKYAASVSGAVELDPEARMIKYFTQDAGRVFVHPSSTMFDAQGFVGNSVYMAYFTKIATSKVFIRDLTPLNAYSLLMFAGDITLDTLGRGVVVDGWLRLRGWARIGVLVGRLRGMVDQILAKRMENPAARSEEDDAIIHIVRKLVELDGHDR